MTKVRKSQKKRGFKKKVWKFDKISNRVRFLKLVLKIPYLFKPSNGQKLVKNLLKSE